MVIRNTVNNCKMKKDNFLLFLIIINLANTIIMLIGGKALNLKYILLIFNLLGITFCPKNKMLPLIFYLHCNSALYDDIGFKYLFNFAIVISVFKLMIIYKQKLNKKNLFLYIIVLLWEILLILKSNDFTGWLSLVSWASSYILLIAYSTNKENVDFSDIYKYFATGFAMAFLCGATHPINRYGINIPTKFRYTGLLRDPNYYSMDAIFLIFSAPTYAKLNNKKPLIYMLLFFALGITSISKTFIILVIIGVFLKIISKLDRLKIKTKNIFLFIIGFTILIIILIQNNILEVVKEKYLYRRDTTTLFTGRDYIQSYYLNELFSSPSNLLLGNSVTKYSKIMGIGQEAGREFFIEKSAHNTYLDILLSWGVIGTGIYFFFIYSVLIAMEKTHNNNKRVYNKDFFITGILFAIGLLALSYLAIDVFAIFILYLLILKYSLYEKTQ